MLILQAVTLCARKGSDHTRLDNLYTYTAENLEHSCTYTCIRGDHAQIQYYNGGTHF